ncbi:MAG: helix-turn-helix domain-containing protein [Cyanobacteria bacterium J06560_2]
MAPRKLSDSDKSELIELYKQPGQTTSTLAEQYGVSNSTVSRILKNSIPAEEYSALISQKRMAGSDAKVETPSRTRRKKTSAKKQVKDASEEPAVPEFAPAANQPGADGTLLSEEADDDETSQKVSRPKLKTAEQSGDENASAPRRRRRRRSTKDEETGQLPLLDAEDAQVEPAGDAEDEDENAKKSTPQKKSPASPAKPVLASQDTDDEEDEDEDDLLGLDETLGDDFGDDDDDVEEDDEDDDGSDADMPLLRQSSESLLSIMPLDEAVLPKPCYLVVDMRAELITRPLVEFSELGKIPTSEEREKTLPVFDNHRVARRFSRNKQRVIKVPDGGLITRTSPYLTAKGITRLLVDGQVFDLVGMQ